MKRLLLVLLFAAPLFASSVPVAEIYHVVNNPTGFNADIYNDTSDSMDVTYIALDVNGVTEHIGPFHLDPHGGVMAGFGGFPTTGSFSVEFYLRELGLDGCRAILAGSRNDVRLFARTETARATATAAGSSGTG